MLSRGRSWSGGPGAIAPIAAPLIRHVVSIYLNTKQIKKDQHNYLQIQIQFNLTFVKINIFLNVRSVVVPTLGPVMLGATA